MPRSQLTNDADQLDRPALELLGIAFGESEDPGDHPHGKRERQPADEIGATERRERVDQLVDDSSDELVLPAGEELGAERRCNERTMGAVLGLVHRDHRVAEHRAHDLGEDLRRVGLVVAQHRHHLVVAEHVEPRVDVLVDGPHVVGKRPLELHRAVAAGGRQVRIGIVGGAELDRVGQLERIESLRRRRCCGWSSQLPPRAGRLPFGRLRSRCVACIPTSIRHDLGHVKGCVRMTFEPLTPERRRAMTRQHLLDAAAIVFARNGIPRLDPRRGRRHRRLQQGRRLLELQEQGRPVPRAPRRPRSIVSSRS